MNELKELFVVYKPEHVDEARVRASRGETIVCLDFWVERELTKKGIPFRSLREFVDSETGTEEWWVLAQEVVREWYRLPAMTFFEYRGIRLGESPEPAFEAYVSRLLYYVRVYAALKKAYPHARFYIPVSVTGEMPTVAWPTSFELWAVVDAARMARLKGNFSRRPEASRVRLFSRMTGKLFLVRAYNLLISLLPRRGFKIYASEYWSHIAPVMEQMRDAELVLIENGELRKIPWRQLLNYRIRFRNPHDTGSWLVRRTAERRARKCITQWAEAKKEVAVYLSGLRTELDWSPVLEACEYLVTHAAEDIADIDALHRIMKKEKPNVVLELASVGGRQQYYFLMARVAAQLAIPSIELQHAAAYIDPRSAYSRIETAYLASYGTYTNSWCERLGYAPDRLIPLGSPRFDKYLTKPAAALLKGKQLFTKLGLDTARPVLLAAVPFSSENLIMFDSYQLAEFFGTIRATLDAIPGMQVLFKFRGYNHVGATRDYIQEVFPTDSALAGNEDLSALLCASDAAVCGFSTVIYETMLAQKPLVLYPWKVFDTYHAQVYTPAAPLAHSAGEAVAILSRIFSDAVYREELLAQQTQFLEGYSFDGKASGRLAALLQHPLAPVAAMGDSKAA
ncbi:MAG: CDP-glycerol glycerophosphotransferase family protein [Minisyncoccia bacterium]